MKYKIGIIGATQSVERIMIVSREFEDGIKFVPLPFESEKVSINVVIGQGSKLGWTSNLIIL